MSGCSKTKEHSKLLAVQHDAGELLAYTTHDAGDVYV
jgi:hypothetical protein